MDLYEVITSDKLPHETQRANCFGVIETADFIRGTLAVVG